MNMKWSAVGTSLDYLVLNDRTTVNNELEKMWEEVEFELVREFDWKGLTKSIKKWLRIHWGLW